MAREPGGGPPKYQRVADDLRARIEAGEFADGRLPTERDLRDHYAMSQGTVRAAIDVLRDEGIVESRVGSGVYVRSWRPIVRNARERLRSQQWGQGKSMWDVDVEDRDLDVRDVQIEQLPAAPDVARALDLPEGDLVWRRNRQYVVDGVPVMRATEYIPDNLARGTRITQIDTGPGGVYARLGEGGHPPVRFREEVQCRPSSPAETADLNLAAGRPVVEIVRYAYGTADRVLTVNRMILDASKYLLQYDFPA